MKNSVTDFEGENELVTFNNNILGNYSTESFFGNFNTQMSHFWNNSVTSQIQKFSQTCSSRCVNMLEKTIVNSFFLETVFRWIKVK